MHRKISVTYSFSLMSVCLVHLKILNPLIKVHPNESRLERARKDLKYIFRVSLLQKVINFISFIVKEILHKIRSVTKT